VLDNRRISGGRFGRVSWACSDIQVRPFSRFVIFEPRIQYRKLLIGLKRIVPPKVVFSAASS
jgi:hypothetical protein